MTLSAPHAISPALLPRDEGTPAPNSAPHAPEALPLSITAVTKRWAREEPPVLDRLDLALRPGTITWVGGRNGAGKTTMLRIAAGLIQPEQGRAEVWGRTALEDRARYHSLVSFLPAGDRGLYARLTVRRQLEFWARISMTPNQRVRPAVDAAIEAFELDGLAERRVDRMSMGQRQRLRIAMTFLTAPQIVLLDEPLTSLDADAGMLLRRAISELLARDGAALWCSPSGEHLDMQFHARWLLHDGRLVPT